MAERAGVSVVGLSRLRRDLRRVGSDMADLKEAHQAVGRVVLEGARPRIHNRSGRLGASGRASKTAGRASVMFGGARLPYAGPIHYGWPAHGIEANPFATDAAAATEPVWLPIYEHQLETVAHQLDGNRY